MPDHQLDKLDPPHRTTILKFLHERVARLDNPRSIGEALRGSKLGEFGSIASATTGYLLHRDKQITHPRVAYRASP